jgi:hypothetical protein
MASFKNLYFVFCFCLLFSRQIGSDNLMNKGGFVFERVVTGNLNQEFMSFTRQLDTELLRPLISNLKGLINIHDEICTKAATSNKGLLDLKDADLSPSMQYYMTPRTAIFTPRFSTQHESAQICSTFDSHLPEYNLENAQAIQSVCRQDSLVSIPVDIYLNTETKNLHYKSNDLIVPETLFSNFFIYGDNKSPYKRSELSNMTQYLFDCPIYLNFCSSKAPALTFLARGSESTKIVKIVCEKTHNMQKSPDDLASQFLYQWVSHSCERDHPVLSQHVDHALVEVNNILDMQIDTKKLLTYAQYFPQLISQPSPLPTSSHISVDLRSNPSSFLQSIEPSVKHKRSVQNATEFQKDTELKNFTEISAEEFFKMLNISNTELIQQIYKTYKTEKPTFTQIEQFILNSKLQTHTNSTYTLMRHKRHWIAVVARTAIHAVVAGVALYAIVNFVQNLVNLDFEDMVNDQPALATAEQLNSANGRISQLSINQLQIQQAIMDGEKTINKIQREFSTQTFAIATWAAQLDVKNNIQFGLQVLSDFILKLVSILLGIQSGKTSPFALNIKELTELQFKVATQYAGVVLTNKLSEIKTTRLNTDKTLTLQFTIPISSPETEYVFYKVIPIPIFEGNTTYIPSSPFTNLAMAKQNHYYTTLSSEEFATCMGSPSICNTHYPMKYISTNFDCILTSFLNNQLTCPLTKTETVPYPFFYFNELNAIYSVPQLTKIRSTCYSPIGQRTDQTHDLNGTGSITFQPNCKITTTGSPFEFHYNTPKVSVTQNIAHWHTFDNIKFNIIPDTSFIVTPQLIHNLTSNLNLTEIIVPTWEELLKDSFQPKSSLKTIFQLLLYIVPIVLIIYLIRFLNNTKTCTAVKGATKNRTSRFYAGKIRWIQKRSTDFNVSNNPPVPSNRFISIHPSFTPLRPIQAAAVAHSLNPHTANVPFTDVHLQAQQRLDDVNYQRETLYPTREEMEDIYSSPDNDNPSAPPAYAPIIRPPRYNLRSGSTPEVRFSQSHLPAVPVTFEMK